MSHSGSGKLNIAAFEVEERSDADVALLVLGGTFFGGMVV